jgi:hypothetical protein
VYMGGLERGARMTDRPSNINGGNYSRLFIGLK